MTLISSGAALGKGSRIVTFLACRRRLMSRTLGGMLYFTHGEDSPCKKGHMAAATGFISRGLHREMRCPVFGTLFRHSRVWCILQYRWHEACSRPLGDISESRNTPRIKSHRRPRKRSGCLCVQTRSAGFRVPKRMHMTDGIPLGEPQCFARDLVETTACC